MFSPKMMILQMAKHPVPLSHHTLGNPTRMTSQKGGYKTSTPALDLTTLFEVMLWNSKEFGLRWANATWQLYDLASLTFDNL